MLGAAGARVGGVVDVIGQWEEPEVVRSVYGRPPAAAEGTVLAASGAVPFSRQATKEPRDARRQGEGRVAKSCRWACATWGECSRSHVPLRRLYSQAPSSMSGEAPVEAGRERPPKRSKCVEVVEEEPEEGGADSAVSVC